MNKNIEQTAKKHKCFCVLIMMTILIPHCVSKKFTPLFLWLLGHMLTDFNNIQ